MFGHLRVNNCRLADSERAIYRSHFCAVCHSLHGFAGWDASLLTNYDVTLWSLVASGISATDYTRSTEMRACTALPFRKVEVQPLSPELGASLASLTVLLAWAKAEDYHQDGAKVLGWLGQAWLGTKESKARQYLLSRGYPLDPLLGLSRRQALAERQTQPTLSGLAGPTQEVLADAFAWIATLAQRGDLEEDLRALGRAIAGFVYVWDALEDLAADRASGRFNALIALWGTPLPAETVRALLLGFLTASQGALDRLPMGNRRQLGHELVLSLEARVQSHPLLKTVAQPLPSKRRRLRQAGFVGASDADCDCCDSCCEVGCCDSGQESCNCCELSCCDGKLGDSCCELDCCDCFCCIYDRNSGKSPCCRCCAKETCTQIDKLSAKGVPAEGDLLCPACRFEAPEVSRRYSWAHRCNNCGGLWVDGAHQDPVDPRQLRDKKAVLRAPGIAVGKRDCPACNTPLSSPAEPDGFEGCPQCQGRFYQGPISD